MWTEILVVFFIGGLIGLDNTAAWQVLLSHPLLACTVLGIAFGEPQLGLFFGIIFELVWLYDIPVGGAQFPEGNLSSFVGLMITLTLFQQYQDSQAWLVLCSCVFVVISAYFLGFTVKQLRKFNLRIVHQADHYAEAGSMHKIQQMHLIGIFHTFFHSALWSLILYLIGVVLVQKVLYLFPANEGFTLGHLQAMFLGVGLSVMMSLFITKKKIQYLLFGIICGIGLGFIV